MSTERRHPNVVNVSEIESQTMEKGARFGCSARRLGTATGAAGIGCTWFEVQAGRTAFPAHHHHANEESLYVLEGTGMLRIGDAEVAVGAGDYATFPVGEAHTHQLVNTGDTPLRYLCFSTLNPVEVVGYPDSNKTGAMVWPSEGQRPTVRVLVRTGETLDYYDGERIDWAAW
jgi:uncharacterized cupin superfamily protein